MNLKKNWIDKILFLIFLFSIINIFSLQLFAQDELQKIINIKPENYVSDFAQILSYEDEEKINNLSRIIESNSKNQIAIVTIESLGFYPIEEFSYKLLESWGIGRKDSNNGILILLALNEKKVRIEVGYGLESLITDGKAALIIQNQGIPYFRQGNYAAGLFNMVYKLGDIIAQSMGQNFSDWLKQGGIQPQNDNEGIGFFFIVLLIILFFIFSILFRRPRYVGYRDRSIANQLFGAYLASNLMRNTFFGNNIGNTRNSGFGGFKGGGFGGFGGFGGGSSGGGGATGGW